MNAGEEMCNAHCLAVGKKNSGDKAYVMTLGKDRAVYTKVEFGLSDLFKDFAELRK